MIVTKFNKIFVPFFLYWLFILYMDFGVMK